MSNAPKPTMGKTMEASLLALMPDTYIAAPHEPEPVLTSKPKLRAKPKGEK